MDLIFWQNCSACD